MRFLRARSGDPCPFADGSARGGASIVMESAGTLEPSSAGTLGEGSEANQVAVMGLASTPVRDQQVDVAQHLREGQERLGDRDVAPQLLGDLIRGAGTLADQAKDPIRATAVEREALVDQ